MSIKPKRWHERVADMPKLTAEQVKAVKDILDYHLFHVSSDFPAADEAHALIQNDLDVLVEPVVYPPIAQAMSELRAVLDIALPAQPEGTGPR